MTYDYGRAKPDMQETGTVAISRCCTASVHEFSDTQGKLWLCSHVAGHEWNEPWEGSFTSEYVKLCRADGMSIERKQ